VVIFFSRNASTFTCSHLDVKKFSPEEKPRTPAYKGEEEKVEGREGTKGLLPLKEE